MSTTLLVIVNIDGTGICIYRASVNRRRLFTGIVLILTSLTVAFHGWFSWRANNITGRDMKEIDAIFRAIFLGKGNHLLSVNQIYWLEQFV